MGVSWARPNFKFFTLHVWLVLITNEDDISRFYTVELTSTSYALHNSLLFEFSFDSDKICQLYLYDH